MFTGIIEDTGIVTALQKNADDITIEIQAHNLDLSKTQSGDSIAVNGVCLTAVAIKDKCFAADISAETLAKTTLSRLKLHSKVNLEKPLTLNTVLGGHLVSGHVDGVATIAVQQSEGRSVRFVFEVEAAIAKYIALKGSVCLDGVSLTVNKVESNRFEVNIIPHTLQKTIFQDYKVGSVVNIEVDIIARYVERLMQHEK